MAPCEVPDCEKPRGHGRKCYMHYSRMRYHGSTDSPLRPWQDRFWEKVDRSGQCWVWTSATDRAGYGLLGGRAPMRQAHRLSYLLAYGDPGDYHVCHTCDNPPCVRPEHLFLGDDAANLGDMATKGRSAWGGSNSRAKLTAPQVHQIRELLAAGVLQREIAQQFDVSRPTVSDIKRGRSWYQLR
jgi:hypothetical protein